MVKRVDGRAVASAPTKKLGRVVGHARGWAERLTTSNMTPLSDVSDDTELEKAYAGKVTRDPFPRGGTRSAVGASRPERSRQRAGWADQVRASAFFPRHRMVRSGAA